MGSYSENDIAQQAMKFKLLILYDVHTGGEWVPWADKMIDALTSPPMELLQLSTLPPEKTENALTLLTQLANGANFWIALEEVLPSLRRRILTHPHDAERIARELFLSVCGFLHSEVPDKFHFAYEFDDAFSLAREGTYGDPAAVLQNFMEKLGQFE